MMLQSYLVFGIPTLFVLIGVGVSIYVRLEASKLGAKHTKAQNR
jgi:hypothetical protein